jgi:hypothetical protein
MHLEISLTSLPLGKFEDYKGTPCNDSIKMKFPQIIFFQEKNYNAIITLP